MDLRSLVKLAAAVLGLMAVGMLLTGVVIAAHGGPTCGSESHPCETNDTLDAAKAAFFAVKALTFGAGATLGLTSLVLLGYLKQSGPNPAR